jgi:4-hydroxy-2-oxoheptanedioate aldolase
VLDHGAAGVVIAMASSVALVEQAVALARYQPDGVRSYGGQRYGLRAEPIDVADVRPAVYPMIEDRRGVDTVAAIARVPGIAGLHVGPVDLGLGLGLGLDRADARFDDALDAILAAGRRASIGVTLHAVSAADGERWHERGFDELVLSADIQLLRTAFEDGVARLRGRASASTIGAYGRREERPAPES